MKSSKRDLPNGVTVTGRQALDMVARAAMVIDKHLIEPARMADMAVTAILPLFRRPSVVS